MNRSVYNSPSERYPSGVSDQHDFEYDGSIIDRQTLRRVVGILYEKKLELRALQALIHQERLLSGAFFFLEAIQRLSGSRGKSVRTFICLDAGCVCVSNASLHTF